jgi:glyoxylase-like metal-dependent hydrolase (beta-lactamase superfamily II)
MAATQLIVDGLWSINLGQVNAFVIDDGELTLVDTGFGASPPKIVAALEALGKQVADVRHILVTHCHPDHAGGLAAIKQQTSANAYMHPADAAMVRKGNGKRPLIAAPGALRKIMFNLFVARASGDIAPCAVDREIGDGAQLPIGGGLQAIHVPGHCAGQLAFHWPRRGVLIAADTASNMPSLGLSLGYEDLQEGLRSLAKVAALDFDVACFGHGTAIKTRASERFKAKWGSVQSRKA